MRTIKSHEQYTVAEGNFVLVVSLDLTSDKPRLTLSKPDSFGGNAKARDYHFEQSDIEAVEGFAKCALEAVRIAREAMPKITPKTKAKK